MVSEEALAKRRARNVAWVLKKRKTHSQRKCEDGKYHYISKEALKLRKAINKRIAKRS